MIKRIRAECKYCKYKWSVRDFNRVICECPNCQKSQILEEILIEENIYEGKVISAQQLNYNTKMCPNCNGTNFKTGKINHVKICKNCNSIFKLGKERK